MDAENHGLHLELVVTIHGHSHPALANALYQQAQQLEHVIFTGFTHEPAEQLAHKLLPTCLNRDAYFF